ncbi:MAG: pyrroline-5-carboxylate reductase dimerization domain-containing protein [Aliishimia sp.]
MARIPSFGIIGTGMLGEAMMLAVAHADIVTSGGLWAANRSGTNPKLAELGVTVTSDIGALLDACDTILLCVPPNATQNVIVPAQDKLVLSVMAGTTVSRLAELTGSSHIVRAMSSPAAAQSLAFSPWIAGPTMSHDDKATVVTLLEACGTQMRVETEHHLDVFTAITGPVPGFVAAFAASVQKFAQSEGVPSDIAQQAVRQLFLAGGHALMEAASEPQAFVDEMIDYDGTTAAGLRALRDGPLEQAVAEALQAAVKKTKTIAPD